ncbi:MAG: urea ABC transporter permease subunit UrtB, partial [Gammaproteobacteria bacterium]
MKSIHGPRRTTKWILIGGLSLLTFMLPAAYHGGSTANADETTTQQAATQPTPTEQLSNQKPAADPFVSAIENLKQRSFSKKGKAIEQLQSLDDPRILKILQYMLHSDLYYRKSDERVIFVDKTDSGYTITDVISGQASSQEKKSDLKKIIVNNRLRKQLRGAIAQINLNSKDADVRLGAVKELMRDASPQVAAMLRERMAIEPDSDVKETMETVIALAELNSDDNDKRLAAIELLGGSMEEEAFSNLSKLVQKDYDGSFLEPDEDIREAANAALTSIKDRRSFYELMETIFFGLSLGSVLLLAAIGLAITFGVMGVINMAHGELIMLGAYTTYVVQLLMPNYIEYSLFVAVPAAFLVSGIAGVIIERGVIRFLYGRPLETLLATFGISLILQQLVRTIFSPLNRSVETPQWMSGALEINSAFTLTYNRFYIVIFSLMVFFALL